MATALKSEINGEAISIALDILNKDIQDSNDLIGEINKLDAYIGSNKDLEGGAFDVAKSNMEKLKSIIESRISAARQLSEQCKAAALSLSDYMGEFSYLSDKDLPTLRARLASLKNQLYEYYELLRRLSYGEKVALPAISVNQIKAQIFRIEKLIERIEGLPGADSSAYGMLSGAQNTASSYAIQVASIM